MNKFFVLTLLASAAIASSQGDAVAPLNDIGDYWQAWDCNNPSIDNSKYVLAVDWYFTTPPQVGVSDDLTTYFTMKKDTYLSTVQLTVRSAGILLYTFTDDIDRLFPANVKTMKGMWIPTE